MGIDLDSKKIKVLAWLLSLASGVLMQFSWRPEFFQILFLLSFAILFRSSFNLWQKIRWRRSSGLIQRMTRTIVPWTLPALVIVLLLGFDSRIKKAQLRLFDRQYTELVRDALSGKLKLKDKQKSLSFDEGYQVDIVKAPRLYSGVVLSGRYIWVIRRHSKIVALSIPVGKQFIFPGWSRIYTIAPAAREKRLLGRKVRKMFRFEARNWMRTRSPQRFWINRNEK
jgi:hypothetical protein